MIELNFDVTINLDDYQDAEWEPINTWLRAELKKQIKAALKSSPRWKGYVQTTVDALLDEAIGEVGDD